MRAGRSLGLADLRARGSNSTRKFLNLSRPQLPRLYNGAKMSPRQVGGKMSEAVAVKGARPLPFALLGAFLAISALLTRPGAAAPSHHPGLSQ